MSLAAIAAAATAVAAAEKRAARQNCSASDETDGETDPFESDTSAKKRERVEDGERDGKKSKREFPAELLVDLAGSTSAEVRRMNEDERALVHYKRRLRNRESAKRSRARRQATISDIQGELEDLREVTASLVDRCVAFARVNDRQSQELEMLRKENQLLEGMLRSGGSVL